MKKKKQRISDLFYDNRFLLIFSLIVAVIFWLIVVVEYGVEVEERKTVTVSIDYEKVRSDFGLVPFGNSDEYKVDVIVSGKKYIIDAEDFADEIQVKADTSYVTSSGKSTLRLIPGTTSENALFDIVGLSQNEITVYFDYPGEKDFIIEPEIACDTVLAAEGYIVDDYIFSGSNTVTATGPETNVNKITKVVARAEVDGELKESKTIEASLVALNENGETVSNITFTNNSGGSTEKSVITLPVYKLATLPVSCRFTGKPPAYVDMPAYTLEISPQTVAVGVPEKKLESIDTLEIAAIDYSSLKVGENTFEINASDLSNAKIVDGTEKFTVTVTVNSMSSKDVRISSDISKLDINFVNQADGVEVELAGLDFTEMVFVGPADSLEGITSDNLVLNVDLGKIKAGSLGEEIVTVDVLLDDCWLYGEYTATVNIM